MNIALHALGRHVSLALTFAAVLGTGCATSGGLGSIENAVVADGEQVAVVELSKKLNIGQPIVATALSTSKTLLAGGAKTAQAKTAAITQGVQKAGAQAIASGTPLTPQQTSGLTSGLTDLIKL